MKDETVQDLLDRAADGNGYGDPEARSNDERKLQVLLTRELQCSIAQVKNEMAAASAASSKIGGRLNLFTLLLVVVGLLNIAVLHLDKFAYEGVFGSGLFGIVGQARPGAPPTSASGTAFPWEEQHRSELDNSELKGGLKLLWFGTGKDDFLVATSKATVDLLKKHGFNAVYEESTGGHTWIKWRNYLNVFAPQLFH